MERGQQEIVSTTGLDAPRELVFKAYSDPKLFAQWGGPRRYEIKIDKFDSRAGGEWRVIHKGADGAEYAFRGVNHDVVAPERICATFSSKACLATSPCRRQRSSRWATRPSWSRK